MLISFSRRQVITRQSSDYIITLYKRVLLFHEEWFQ